MRVELIDYQKNALDILLYTKNTRLRGEFPTLRDIEIQPHVWKLEQLAYMKDTIKSSWEFADYTFEVSDVSRNLTHQMVRTRTASFAQEAQRVVDLSETEYYMPAAYIGNSVLEHRYLSAVHQGTQAYIDLVNFGSARQDARNAIPTGVLTSIIVKANLRTLHNMAELRLCFRVQDEFQRVFAAMKAAVVKVHPWVDEFIQVYCVNHATCAFPRYKECPIQHLTIRGPALELKKQEIREAHEKAEHEANPVVNEKGMTM